MPKSKYEAHIKVCPKAVQLNKMQSLPYYKCDVNILERPIVKSDEEYVFTPEKIHMIYNKISEKYKTDFPAMFCVFE